MQGGVWTPPYQLDVTDWVKEGRNELCIEVVNTWVNRLIGDSQLPTSQRGTWCRVNSHRPFEPLQTSGLLGPVQLFCCSIRPDTDAIDRAIKAFALL